MNYTLQKRIAEMMHGNINFKKIEKCWFSALFNVDDFLFLNLHS
jgi:hypothetical protein